MLWPILRVALPRRSDSAVPAFPIVRQAHLCRFLARHGTPLDEGFLLYFAATHTYTGEDVVEIQGPWRAGRHADVACPLSGTGCAIGRGRNLSSPGVLFSITSWISPRLRGVIDLIDASTQAAARSALRSLSERVLRKRCINGVTNFVNLRRLVEATLDFPEEEIDFLQAANGFRAS